MTKESSKSTYSAEINNFLKDLGLLSALSTSNKYRKIHLEEFPFDAQLLNASLIYRKSRQLYLSLGGTFNPRVCSTMRALSAQDLFKDEIDFTPSWSEILWFKDNIHEVSGPEKEIEALTRFNEISVFHEQNHRVVWRLLPPAPKEERDFCRYLNFAESLVVTLDLALGDELGRKHSTAFERMKVIYRSGDANRWKRESKEAYRKYLLANLCATYYALEMVHYDDILNAVNYVFPGQKAMNKQAVNRALDISELFTRITNPLWQERYWKSAQKKLSKIHQGHTEAPLYLPEDPLDLEEEFFWARRMFDVFGI